MSELELKIEKLIKDQILITESEAQDLATLICELPEIKGGRVGAEVKPDACGKWSLKKPDKPCLILCRYYWDKKYYKVKEINYIKNDLVVIDKYDTDITWVSHEEFDADEYYIIEWL